MKSSINYQPDTIIRMSHSSFIINHIIKKPENARTASTSGTFDVVVPRPMCNPSNRNNNGDLRNKNNHKCT
jgi:hypothetical protein